MTATGMATEMGKIAGMMDEAGEGPTPLQEKLKQLGRFVAAVLSGVVFFAEYAGDQNPWVYSIGYNGAYMLPECIICVVLALAVGLRLTQQLSKAK